VTTELLSMTKCDPFKYFKTSVDTIRLAVMLCIWLPQSHRNVEELLHERGIEINHEADFGVKGILTDLGRSTACSRSWRLGRREVCVL